MKRVPATTKYYITHLARLAYQDARARGLNVSPKECLMAVLKEFNVSVWIPGQAAK